MVAVNKASDLNESVNKTNEVFGAGAKDILKWSKTSATAFGQSQKDALDAASNFGLFAQAAGQSGNEVNKFSKQMVVLAGDLSSFFNIDSKQALEDLRSGLAGQSEPLRKYGIFLTEAAVAQEAARLGIAKLGTELTEGEKILARQSLILQQTGKAQGDFARTSDGLANSTRIAAAQFDDLQAKIGQVLLPVFKLLVEGAMAVVDFIEANWKPSWEAVSETFTNAWDAVRPFLAAIADVLIPLFQTAWHTIQDRIIPVFERLKPLFIVIGAAIVVLATMFLTQLALVVTAVGFVIDKFLDLVGFVRDKVVEPIVNFLGRLGDAIGKVADWVRDRFVGAWNAVKGPVLAVIGAIISAVQTLVGWLIKAVEWLAKLVPGAGFAETLGGGVADIVRQNPGIIPEGATGGFVARSGLAVIHRGENIVPADRGMGLGSGDIVLQINGATFARITRDELVKLGKRNVTTGI